jgi:outer membrane autotransporter protein
MRQAMLGRLRQSAYADGAEGGLAPLGLGGPVASIPGGTTLSASAADFAVASIHDEAPVFPSRLTFWSQAVGAWGTIDGNGNAAEAQRDFGGLFAGMDAQFGEAGRIGIAGGYTQSSLSLDERLSSADVDSGHIGVYAATRLDAFNLRAGAAYAFHDIETARAIVFPGFLDTASAAYDGDTGQVFGEIAYGVALGHIAAEPFAGLAWVHAGTDDFAETGGVAALNGADSDTSASYSTLGIRLATRIMLEDGMTVMPRASAAWQHVFGDVDGTAALAFQNTGAAFGVTGVPIARNAALVEAGVDMLITPEAKLGIAYSGELAKDQQDHAVKGNLSWRF